MPPIILDPTPVQSNPILLPRTSSSSYTTQPTNPRNPRNPTTSRRTLYYAVKTGHRQGVYDNWEDAEASIKGHVGPQWKTFKTIMAAEAFVEGKDGGSFRVNQRTPIPLDEHLKSFPPSTPLSSPSPSPSSLTTTTTSFLPPRTRQSMPPPTTLIPSESPLKPPRPHFARSRVSSGGSSPVTRSSPLRREVTDDEAVAEGETGNGSGSESETSTSTTNSTMNRKSRFGIGFSGWLSPPPSPSESMNHTINVPPAVHVRPSSTTAVIPRPRQQAQAQAQVVKRMSSSSSTPTGGLWGDLTTRPVTPPTSPLALAISTTHDVVDDEGDEGDEGDLFSVDNNAPKFSRRNANVVVMPISAKSRMNDFHLLPTTSRDSSTTTTITDRHRSLPTMKSLKGLHEKLLALSTLRGDDVESTQDTEQPCKHRTVSSVSIASICSEASDTTSVISAEMQTPGSPRSPTKSAVHLSVPSSLIISPLSTPSASASGETVNDPIPLLTPALSNHSSQGGSVVTHTQSEGTDGRYGRRKGSAGSDSTTRSHGRGFRKKLMAALGFGGKVAGKGTGTGRRGSS